jgi:L1 cell adhesion molecule like protein
MIGRRFEDVSVYDIERWPFEVINDNERPKFKVYYKNQELTLKPEEVSAEILKLLKETAESFINEEVTDAVITVPAYFSDSQRQATKDAAEIAGLNVLQLLNEPTAAAVAYGLNKKLKADENILVFDMGGGTFDTSILAIDKELFEVKSVGGSPHLGGEDFNNRILDYFMKEIEQQHGIDVSSDKVAISRLLKECEIAKIALSTSTVADVKVNSLFPGVDFTSTITRARFEDMNNDFFEKAIQIVEDTIKDANLTKDDIQEIVLVGGSTYIPKVQKMLQDCFNGKTLNRSVKPDEAVAFGAAVYASVLQGDDPNDFEMVLLDVTPTSVGTDLKGGIMNVLIEKNTPIPFIKTETYTTVVDDQSEVEIGVYEGEDTDVKKNNFLSTFCLTEIPRAKAGEPVITVTMQINADGILKVSAVNSMNGQEKSITIQEYKDRIQANADN